MLIKFEFPPNYAAVDAKFGLSAMKNIAPIFAWSGFIYNPHRVPVGPELIAHEQIHGERQGGDPEGWWLKYIDDQEFRLDEEIPAHVAEYLARVGSQTDRAHRRTMMNIMAARLVAPLYGYVPRIPVDRARGLLKRAMGIER